jgi:hypothetical protein
MYNEFDIINNFMVNLYQVDVCSTSNLNLLQRYNRIDNANLRTGHRVLLVAQADKTQNDVYTVDTRGYLILGDEFVDTGRTWRYKAYVKLGDNKGKQFFLKNSGNRFPLKGERKDFLDGHGYVIKSFFNYDLFDSGTIVPKLVFTDYEIARISVNHNYDLYTGFDLPIIFSGGTVDIKYHNNDYIINVWGDLDDYLFSCTGSTGNGVYNIMNTSGETWVLTNSDVVGNCNINDYLLLSATGSTLFNLNTYVKSKSGNYVIINDYIPDDILNDFYYDTLSTNYYFRNLNYSTSSTFKETMSSSFFSKYFSISGSTVSPIQYDYNRYFDYDGLSFVIDSNGGDIHGYIYGSILPGAVISSSTGYQTTSGDNGYYQLFLPIGNQIITVAYTHYINYTQSINVTNGSSSTLNFNMIHNTGVTTGTVVDSISLVGVSGAYIYDTTSTGITNGSGVYIMVPNPLSGSRVFTCVATNYITQIISSNVPDGGSLTLNFNLLHTPILPSVTTDITTNISPTGATSGGNVTNDGYATVISRGVCWSTSTGATLSNNYTINGTGIGTFISNITGLNPGITYYVRSYATNSSGTSYGNETSFTSTMIKPTITTDSITNIDTTTATSGGNITSDGGSAITARGVCWSLLTTPTTGNSYITNGTGSGTFTSNLTGLTTYTLYYIRAYATNGVGTSYGNERTFMTINSPVVTTTTITNIGSTTATSGGDVTSDGGVSVTARGVCWSTATGSTISNSFTNDGSGTGVFISNMVGLLQYTTYYVRSYATNSVGTSYGTEISFSTLSGVAVVITDLTTNTTSTTATSGGNVTSDGGSPITVRGVCWSIITEPTIYNTHTTDGTGTGVFTSYVTGLTPETRYYARAYATNSIGTIYGNEEIIKTLPF